MNEAARDAASQSTEILRRAKADGSFDVVATAMLMTVVAVVRWERGDDVLREMLELAEDRDTAN
jgi:hypothetical protein